MAELKADWMAREDLAALVAALGPGTMRWVGGAVRDTLLGHAVKDIDAATPLEPAEVVTRLDAAKIRSVPTGIDHGTITAILDGGPVEITTLRHDVSTDGRRATVKFASEWKDDAARRDFTINALYADPVTGEVFDYFGGMADLQTGRVRFIGDARERIREDHLRVLRYYRFQARFGADLDPEAEAACIELAPMLKGLSRERVGWELQNLLEIADPVATVRRMYDTGVLGVVLPEVADEGIAAFVALVGAEHEAGLPPSPLRRLAALLPADEKAASQVASRLRLSTANKKRLTIAARRNGAPGDPHVLAYRLGREAAIDRLLLAGEDPSPLSGWDIPELPLKGGEIVARGIAAGPEVARVLQAVEERWIAEGFPARERVKALLDAELAGRKAN
ncbi:CCA tRNA nucleotidyltransferase [Altererythrobacter salegens]|uniref:CCA tRNA nucleotidyltransferase n=1 Tax=Croceibacterium salegens TaxID=1737568 RepID=A0A6I4T207_9SPHN|nr:CCA tRNA nucleotidyltransferase [Croceibacterium salegens]MXO61380.1 CCA tRNA nucleotidyltransferase [Croceibacterium salegens]